MTNLNGTTHEECAGSWINGNISWVRDEIIQNENAMKVATFAMLVEKELQSESERDMFRRYLARWEVI